MARLMGFQDSKGWFSSSDFQRHCREHSTAYALAGLQLLNADRPGNVMESVRPLTGLARVLPKTPGLDSPPYNLSLLYRTHFWRGAHRVAGVAAIIGALSSAWHVQEKAFGIASPHEWLSGWAEYYVSRISPDTGLWEDLAPALVKRAFNIIYRTRHNPLLAQLGGAAHLYWVLDKLKVPYPHPQSLAETALGLQGGNGLYENHPYCIDFDADYVIGRSLAQLGKGDDALREKAKALLVKSRDAVLRWLSEKPVEQWPESAHFLPGALAAVAEVDRVVPSEDGKPYKDVFEFVWWL